MDLTTMTDSELDQLRQDITAEMAQREKVQRLPGEVAAMTRDAVAAGCDPEELRDRVDEALTPEQAAALDA